MSERITSHAISPFSQKEVITQTSGSVMGCFPEEVFNRDVYLKDCPTADDVWFNAMRLLGGIRVTKVYSPNRKGDYMALPSSRVNALWSKNRKGNNDLAIAAVYGRYGLYAKLANNK